MWAVRESLRLLGRVLIGVAIAVVIAGVKALVSGGDTFHTFRVVCMLVGVLMLFLAAAPAASLGGRRMRSGGWWETQAFGFGTFADVPGPRLTATAVFIASGVVLLVLGAVA